MRKAREMVQLLVSTLEGLKSEKSFNELCQISHKKAKDLKSFVEKDANLEVYFDLEEAKIPRKLKWTKSPEELYRVNHFEASLNKIIEVLNVRFLDKDKDIVIDLVTIVNDKQVEEEVFERVGKVYNIDSEELKSEHLMFQHFKVIQ